MLILYNADSNDLATFENTEVFPPNYPLALILRITNGLINVFKYLAF